MERERLIEGGGVGGRRLMAKCRKVARAVEETGRDRREGAAPRIEIAHNKSGFLFSCTARKITRLVSARWDTHLTPHSSEAAPTPHPLHQFPRFISYYGFRSVVKCKLSVCLSDTHLRTHTHACTHTHTYTICPTT